MKVICKQKQTKSQKTKKSNEFITSLEKEHHREIKIPMTKWKR